MTCSTRNRFRPKAPGRNRAGRRAFPLLLGLVTGMVTVPNLSAIVDVNTNQISDVWEAAYSVQNVIPTLDNDGDGQDNRNESVAGTDPSNAGSVFRVENIQTLNAAHLLRWNSVVGKRYQVETSTSLSGGDWVPQGAPIEGTGSEVLAAVPQTTPPILALRVQLQVSNPAVINGRPHLQHVDTDTDGVPDIDEWAAGTNPFDAGSFLAVDSVTLGDAVLLNWPSVVGKQYQVESADSLLTGPWIVKGGVTEGTGSSTTVAVDVGDDSRWFRVSVADSDSDLDGVSDWEEKMTGLEQGPWHYRTNFPTDPALVTSLVAQTNVINIEPAIPVANATQQESGSFRVTRSGNVSALTINYVVNGTAVADVDYEALAGSVALPPGMQSVDIPVTPLSDAALTLSRSVVVTLDVGTDYELGTNTTAQVNVVKEVALSVTDFGAIGDGVTDDTLPIQAAIDALEASTSHNTLHFPAGTYRLNTTSHVTTALTAWHQLLALGSSDLGGRDLLITGDSGAELYSTVNGVRARMLVVDSTFRSLMFRGLTWRKSDAPLPATIYAPNGADGVFLLRHDLRRVEAVDFLDCTFINCHGAVFIYSTGYDTRGRLVRFEFKRCTVLNPYGSNTEDGFSAYGGGVQLGLNQWIGRAIFSESLFDGGTNGSTDTVRNPGGVRKDGSHFGSPLHLIFTNNVVRHMRAEAVFQTDDPIMGVLEASFEVPPADGSTIVEAKLKPDFLTTYQAGQVVNVRTPNTPWADGNDVLLTVVSYATTNRMLSLKNDGLTVGAAGTTVPASNPLYLQSSNTPPIADIMGNIIEDEEGTPTGLLAIGADSKATISGNFIRNYLSAVYLYPSTHDILFPPRPGTLIEDNVILAQNTSLYPFAWGIWSHGPRDIIAHNLVVAPNSRRFIGVVTHGEEAWVEGNTALAVSIEHWPYDSANRSVGIAAGNTSSNTTQVANWTFGMEVGNGPEKPYQSPPRKVLSHHSTNDTLAIDPRGLMP